MFFRRTLDALRVKANDTQFFISSAGEIYMFDFDYSNWISSDNELWDYAAASTIQAEDFARLKTAHGDAPIRVSNDEFEFDIVYLRQGLADNQ